MTTLKTCLIICSMILLKECSYEPISDMPSDNSWELIWQEEFDGTEIDWNVWSKAERNKSDWGKHMASADELFEIKNGYLTVKAINNTNYPNDTSAILTGGLASKGKKSFNMEKGRIDVRARFDSGQSFWPAIWMMGDIEAAWPLRGEIDIMEHLNNDDSVYHTVHTVYTKTISKTNPISHGKTPINKNKFNIYSVEGYKDSLVFLVNDTKTFTYRKSDFNTSNPITPNEFPFMSWNFQVLLTAQVGGSWVGQATGIDLPLQMDVDWVRFYKKNE